MSTDKKILAIGAHPDDIEYGCGGTLIKYREKGYKVYLLILTDGSRGGNPRTRRREQLEAAKYLNADDVILGKIKDTKLVVSNNTIAFVDSFVKKIKPEIIFVNYYDDTHQDHRACAQIAMASARQIDSLLFYEDYTTINFKPNIFVDITSIIEKKEKLISFHRTQIKQDFYPTLYDLKESIKAIAIYRGFQARKKYAEGFLALRYFLKI
ncbi:MAG: PIG-L deacetylase family protein [Candidatus Hydrogenedentota bacterium]